LKTLFFVRDAERAVAEMARVLKPGGWLVIGELGRWSLWAVGRRMVRYALRYVHLAALGGLRNKSRGLDTSPNLLTCAG